jgi:menaquinone-dependent protoporphyrinogen oxidase
MSKVLVVYWTGTGCTAGVAERIGKTLAAAGMRVDVKPFDSKLEPAGYDAVVAGSGARAGSWHVAAKKWVVRNAAALKSRPLALFTVGTAVTHGGTAEEMRGYTDALRAKSGVEPLDLGVFAGWNDPRKFNWFERIAVKIAKAPEGDFRDWDAIENWASAIAPKLGM